MQTSNTDSRSDTYYKEAEQSAEESKVSEGVRKIVDMRKELNLNALMWYSSFLIKSGRGDEMTFRVRFPSKDLETYFLNRWLSERLRRKGASVEGLDIF